LLFGGGVEFLVVIGGEEALVAADGGLGDDFKDAAGGDFHEPRVVNAGGAGATFGNIRGDGHGSAAHLVGEPKAFLGGEAAREPVNEIGKGDRFLPGFELLKVEHGVEVVEGGELMVEWTDGKLTAQLSTFNPQPFNANVMQKPGLGVRSPLDG